MEAGCLVCEGWAEPGQALCMGVCSTGLGTAGLHSHRTPTSKHPCTLTFITHPHHNHPPIHPITPALKPISPSCRRCAVGEATWPASVRDLSPRAAAAPAPTPHPSSLTSACDWKPWGRAAPAERAGGQDVREGGGANNAGVHHFEIGVMGWHSNNTQTRGAVRHIRMAKDGRARLRPQPRQHPGDEQQCLSVLQEINIGACLGRRNWQLRWVPRRQRLPGCRGPQPALHTRQSHPPEYHHCWVKGHRWWGAPPRLRLGFSAAREGVGVWVDCAAGMEATHCTGMLGSRHAAPYDTPCPCSHSPALSSHLTCCEVRVVESAALLLAFCQHRRACSARSGGN